MKSDTKTELSRQIQIKDLKTRVTHLDIEAEPAEREALARRFRLPAISRLRAKVAVVRLARDRAIRIEGDISAALQYLSVVSLEPFEAEIHESFSEVLTKETDGESPLEVDLPPDEENMGAIVDGGFDLGEVISQNLSLMLEEHPRKAGEEDAPDGVIWADPDAEDEKENPFSVLANMRDRMRNKD